VLSLTKNNKKVFAFLGVFTIVIVVLMIFSNRIFPRYEFIGNSLGTRKIIWENAIKLFKNISYNYLVDIINSATFTP